MLQQVEEGDELREDYRLGGGVALAHQVQLLHEGLDLLRPQMANKTSRLSSSNNPSPILTTSPCLLSCLH